MTTSKALALCLAALHFGCRVALAAPADISTLPLDAKTQATPNLIFGVDDSGSMDFELMLNNNDGALWWDATARSFWNATGVTHFNANGVAGASGGTTWLKYVYLFPNGTSSGNRTYADAASDHYAVPPAPAYVFLRSSDYNPLYYNPSVTYTPWAPAYMSGSTRTFANAPGNAARSHPWFPTAGAPTTFDLTQTLTSTATNWTFRMVTGMTIPGATMAGIQGRRNGAGGFAAVATDYAIPSGEYWDVAIPYYPATYWVQDASCTAAWPACASAPDGTRLRRYEIKPASTFPSGRSYLSELQNFANWFTYYRKRKLMLSAGMGEALETVKGLRGGSVYFNNRQPVTMYDFGATADSSNARALLGSIYANGGSGGTPTRETLSYIGEQYAGNTSIVQFGCQRNAAFILTDGFANASTVTVPSYDPATWVGTRPYQTIHAGSLADIASAYYTNNLRTDLPAGMLNVDPSDTSPAADKNPNLHMNTFGVTLGLTGTIYGTNTPQANNPYLNYPTWPAPTANRHPSSLDDLWHATLNGRGKMFMANNASQLAVHLREVVNSLLTKAGSDAGIAVSNVNLKDGDNTAYVSSYNAQNWTGQLAAFPVNVNTGQVDMSPAAQIWEARDQLTARTATGRLIGTYDGMQGIAFQASTVPAAMKALLATPSVSPSDADAVIAYLRGDRSFEGSTYRTREALLGDIVTAEPVFVGGAMASYADDGYDSFSTTSAASRGRTLYQAANDGMLHAFDAGDGRELWAYVPGVVYGKLNALTDPLYTHQFNVDGTPAAGDVDLANTLDGGRGSGDWRTLLVGGLAAGGAGYYALDVTSPAASSEGDVAGKVLWEFPNASTSASVASNIGYSFGRPVLAKTRAAGWVVLLTSGYNNTAGDGRGHLFVVDAATGALIRDIPTSAGTAGDPSGLAQISAWSNNAALDATIESVYGGDLKGNLWRFDFSGSTAASWDVVRLATFTDGSGAAQSITAAPELAQIDGRRMVFVGTGRLLGGTDISSTQVQSVYGVVDDMTASPTLSAPRTELMNKPVTSAAGGIRNIDPTAVNYSTHRGWYFDLPGPGERVNTAPAAAFGALVFTTNQPSAVACSSQSYLYAVDLANGGQLPSQAFAAGETPWSGKSLGPSLASRPVIVVLPNGSVQSITHKSDTTLTTSRLPVSLGGKVKKVGWKEIFR
jgi:type IV pilus assembly protein PilY1